MGSGRINKSMDKVVSFRLGNIFKYFGGVLVVLLGTFVLIQSWRFYNFARNTVNIWPIILFDISDRLPQIQERYRLNEEKKKAATPDNPVANDVQTPPVATPEGQKSSEKSK